MTQIKLPRANPVFLDIFLHAIFFLFFLQLLTDFVAGIYAFGLLGTGIPPEIVSVLLLFSPVVLFGFQRGVSSKLLFIAGVLFLLCRVIETLLDTRGRMLVSGVGVAIYFVILPSVLSQAVVRREKFSWLPAGSGMVLAILLGFGLRGFNSGIDLSTYGPGTIVGWLLAISGGVVWAWYQFADHQRQDEQLLTSIKDFGHLTSLCLGLMGCLLLLYFGFSTPNVLARWMGFNYAGILAILGTTYALAGLTLAIKPGWLIELKPGLWRLLNIAFAVALVGSTLAARIIFPDDPAAYPVYPGPVSWAGIVLMSVALVLSPVIFINFARYGMEIVSRQPVMRSLAGGFTVASLFLLFMIFAHVSTTAYDYLPVIGPLFRNRFWLVYLLAWTGMFLPGLLSGRDASRWDQASLTDFIPPRIYPPVVILLAAAPVIGAILNQPRPVAVARSNELKIMTYNIQQGYSDYGQKNYAGQLAVIQSLNPDVIGLEETDTNRISGGNDDLIRYLADRLKYYSYYGPGTVAGTFGIALLSRYPIIEPETFYMYSQGEQTATIKAQILADEQLYNIFVTHLGNGGPIVQQQAILEETANLNNVILMGDFNFQPDTEAYHLTTNSLTDSWLAAWSGGIDGSGINSERRIDHIFLSNELNIQDSRFLLDPASDHPALLTTILN